MVKENEITEITESKIAMEFLTCSRDPWHFISNYVYTLHKTMGTQPFPKFEYLKNLVNDFSSDRLILILKSRQMLATWTAVAYAIWEAIFKPGDILFISKRETEAIELISRAKFIYRNLPFWLQPKMTCDNRKEINFGKIDSRIFSVPNSPDAVRTYSPRKIYWDEMPHTAFDVEIWESIAPVIDKDGAFVGIGTPNDPFTVHAVLWGDNANDMRKIKIHWTQHPEKNLEWQKEQKKLYSDEAWQREQELDISSRTELIYTNFSSENVKSDIGDYKAFRLFRALDFGYHTPVCLWGYITPELHLHIFHEWYGEDNTVEELALAIKDVDESLGINESIIEMSYGDPQGEAVTDEGISAIDKIKRVIPDFKFSSRKSNIMPGIDMVRTKVKDARGRRAFTVYGEIDVRGNIFKGCKRLIRDVQRYRKSKNSEMPIKDGICDHGNDALRYLIIGIFGLSDEINPYSVLSPKVVGLIRAS